MYCEQCGKPYEEGSKFCEGCGAVLETENNICNPGVPIKNQYSQGQVATQGKMQPVNTYAAPAYVYNTAVAPKVKKPITVKQKIIMILTGVIVVVAVVFFGVCYTMSNPENTVKDFFNSTVAHDFSKSYDCLDITLGEFTTKDMFIKMMENKAKGMPKKEILNYNIKEVDANKALNGIYESASSPKSAYKNTSNTSSGLMKYYTVEYTEKGSSSAQTGSIILIKQKSKSWLFFDSYKVAAEGIVAKTYNINIPSGAKLNVDGIDINSSNIVKPESSSSNSSYNSNNASDNYKLSNIFAGQHKVKVSADFMKDIEKDIDISDGGKTQITDIEISNTSLDTITKTSEEFLKFVYSSAIEGKNFDALKPYLTTNSNQLKTMESEYKSICSSAKKDDGTGLKEIAFSDFIVSSNSNKLSSNMIYKLQANYKYTYMYTSKGYFDETINEFRPETPRSTNLSIYFICENNKWVINSFDLYVYF